MVPTAVTSRNHFSNLLNQDILTGFVSFKMKLDIGHWTMPNIRKFFLFARRAFPPRVEPLETLTEKEDMLKSRTEKKEVR